MPKIKRGRRHHYSSSRKCYELTWQRRNDKLNNITLNNCAVVSFLEHINIPYTISQLSQWHTMNTENYVELSFLQGSAPSIIKFSVTVCRNLRWNVRVYGRPIPDYNDLYDDFPIFLTSVEVIISVCSAIEQMYVCEGNRDDVFISMINGKGGVIKNDNVIGAYYDVNSKTIHHSKCLLLRKKEGRCPSCQHYRATLRAMKSRVQKSEMPHTKTSCTSHANYRYLDNNELQTRLMNSQTANRTLERTVAKLTDKLNVLIERDGIDLAEEDESELNDIVVELDEAAKARSHFQKIFWQQQHKYNSLDDKRRIRWHPLMIRFALN